MGIFGWDDLPEIRVRFETVLSTVPETWHRRVGAIIRTRNGMTDTSRSESVKNIVQEGSVRGPAAPIREQNGVGRVAWTKEESVVVNECVSHGARNRNPAMLVV